ncbi:MAG: DUF547 domain-containing protein [Planctomycetota bacterium]
MALGACAEQASEGAASKPARPSRPAGRIPDTASLSRLLERVVVAGGVDHARLSEERGSLDGYLREVGRARLEGVGELELLGFYINAYNAATLWLVLEHVVGKGPKGGDLDSVRKVKGFFDAKKLLVAGTLRSLDEIEAAGRALGDARIHFALCCASASCPPLLDRAWVPGTLDEDLGRAARSYLASRHGLQVRDRKVYVSAIFEWYRKDFHGKRGVANFLMQYAPSAARQFLDKDIGYLDYDWSLNRARR